VFGASEAVGGGAGTRRAAAPGNHPRYNAMLSPAKYVPAVIGKIGWRIAIM